MLTFLAIYSPVIATVGLLMAFARTSPGEARSKLSEWAEYLSLKQASSWFKKHTIDSRVLRYGRWAMIILVFGGGLGIGYVLKPNPPASIVVGQASSNQNDETLLQLRRLQHDQYVTLGRVSFF